jgi:hypothetical protein
VQTEGLNNEPHIAVLFSPPGYGKNAAVAHAAQDSGAFYIRAVASRTPLFKSFFKALHSATLKFPAVITVDSLLQLLLPVSKSFMARLVVLITESCQVLTFLPSLRPLTR